MEINCSNKEITKAFDEIINKKVDSVVITKEGKPVAKIVPIEEKKPKRLGLLKNEMGDYDISLEQFNSIEISEMF